MKALWSDPLQLGKYILKNRIMLAAMTRARCDPADGIPNDLLVKYYGQRSGAGIMLTQCASWSKRGCAFPGAGDIYTKQQAEGWKKVISQVHKNGSKIYLQIFHAGRATHSQINGGYQPWAPSAQPILYDKMSVLGGANYPVPKQMTLEDIQFTKKQFEQSIKLAKYAQFDGIQLHGANGYLIDQFTQSHSNRRTDEYGGSVANRCRFVLELIDIALKYFQPYQVGIKFSPVGRNNYMFDQNPLQTYSYILQRLSQRNIGFVEFMESPQSQTPGEKFVNGRKQIQNICKAMRPHFNGLIFGNMVPNPQAGLKKVQDGQCDGISFARLYIVNPDLAERLINGYPLQTKLDYSTFYGLRLQDKSKGFTDYPTYKV